MSFTVRGPSFLPTRFTVDEDGPAVGGGWVAGNWLYGREEVRLGGEAALG